MKFKKLVDLYKNYSCFGLIILFSQKVNTDLFFPNSRLIRFPFIVRGKKIYKFWFKINYWCRLSF